MLVYVLHCDDVHENNIICYGVVVLWMLFYCILVLCCVVFYVFLCCVVLYWGRVAVNLRIQTKNYPCHSNGFSTARCTTTQQHKHTTTSQHTQYNTTTKHNAQATKPINTTTQPTLQHNNAAQHNITQHKHKQTT